MGVPAATRPPLAVAVLVKQVPRFEALALTGDGRLRRDGLEAEMNPYCRRAVALATSVVAERGGSVVAFTLGPEPAHDVLREAVAWATDHGVEARAVHLCDPGFAGSDTLATSRALAAAVGIEAPPGGFDLVVAGLNSVDADTGQVGPQVAELLDLPFLAGVRHLSLRGRTLHARCELDDGWAEAEVDLPAVVTTAERLIEPAKVPEGERRARVPAGRIRLRRAADLGDGPWGAAASPTAVGAVRAVEAERARHLAPTAPVREQVHQAVAVLRDRGALDPALDGARDLGTVPAPSSGATPSALRVLVVAEPDRPAGARELLGAAARLAAGTGGRVVALAPGQLDAGLWWSWGADETCSYPPGLVAEQVAGLVARLADGAGTDGSRGSGRGSTSARVAGPGPVWAILTLSTAWGREVAARAAARLGAGLIGDAIGVEVRAGPAPRPGRHHQVGPAGAAPDHLVAWKPAFGGSLVAAVTASSPVQLVTVRPGALPTPLPRVHPGPGRPLPAAPARPAPPPGPARVRIRDRARDDDLELLGRAPVVIGLGAGVDPEAYDAVEPLRRLLGAELGATRKVTDRGRLPRSRQIGITARSIAPRLYVALGVAGKFNHMVGVRSAHTVLAVNTDPAAPVFDHADAGIVADWRAAVEALVVELERTRAR